MILRCKRFTFDRAKQGAKFEIFEGRGERDGAPSLTVWKWDRLKQPGHTGFFRRPPGECIRCIRF